MRAEIVNVGTELLIGSTLNTHQQYLARELGALGIDLYTATTLGDNPQRLGQTITAALFRSDLIVVTGGLGPTDDDITVAATARALGLDLVLNQTVNRAIRRRLESRGVTMNAFQTRQSWLPRGSRAFPNPNGTAPGVLISVLRAGRRCHLALLPGPPRELCPMFQDHLKPALQKILGPTRETLAIRRLFFPGAFESDIAPQVKSWLNSPPPVTVGIYARAGEVELAVMAKSKKETEANRLADSAERDILKRFPKRLTLKHPETLSSFIGAKLLARRATLSVAESCTGGLLAARITDTPGASAYFLGSITAYDNKIKTQFLGIDKKLIARHGAVSPQTASAMAQTAHAKFKTDFALSVTGIAGPGGGSHKKPVGLVFIGLAGPKGVQVFRHHFLGTRSDIRTKAAQSTLTHLANLLRSELKVKVAVR